jgi:hypothetical protein
MAGRVDLHARYVRFVSRRSGPYPEAIYGHHPRPRLCLARCLSRAPCESIIGLDAGAGDGVCKSLWRCPYDVNAPGLQADLSGAMRHHSEASPHPAVGP